MEILPLPHFPADEVCRVWNEFWGEKYAISTATYQAKTSGHVTLLRDASFGIEQGGQLKAFLISKGSPAHSLYEGPDPQRAHLAGMAFADPAQGHALLDQALPILKEKGYTNLTFGMDNGHFFPGLPVEAESLADLLRAAGFTQPAGQSVDLERDLHDYEIPAVFAEPLARADVHVNRCEPSDIDALEQFLQREFPGRWWYDTMHKCRVQAEPNDVFILRVGGEVEGFAYTQSWRTTQIPIAGCVWNLSLGDRWGGLGPIGVSKNVRGQGLGHALLGAALAALRDAGVRRCIIDWTTLIDFYGAHGFTVNRRYDTFVRSL